MVLNAHLDFIKRLGEKYDGHPDIDHIDLGSIGWWGEWHLSMNKQDADAGKSHEGGQCLFRRVQEDAAAHADRRRRLPEIRLCPRRGLAGRLSGRPGRILQDLVPHEERLPRLVQGSQSSDTWKTAPVAFETCWEMQKWVKEGWSLRTSSIMPWPATHRNQQQSAPLPQGPMFDPKSNDSCAGSATASF